MATELQLDLPIIVKYNVGDFASKQEAWLRINKPDPVDYIINRLIPGYPARLLKAETVKPFIMILREKHGDGHYLISSMESFIKSLCNIFDNFVNDYYYDMKPVLNIIKSRDDFKALFVLARSYEGHQYEKLDFDEFMNV